MGAVWTLGLHFVNPLFRHYHANQKGGNELMTQGTEIAPKCRFRQKCVWSLINTREFIIFVSINSWRCITLIGRQNKLITMSSSTHSLIGWLIGFLGQLPGTTRWVVNKQFLSLEEWYLPFGEIFLSFWYEWLTIGYIHAIETSLDMFL